MLLIPKLQLEYPLYSPRRGNPQDVETAPYGICLLLLAKYGMATVSMIIIMRTIDMGRVINVLLLNVFAVSLNPFIRSSILSSDFGA
jgi:hypothetical protein